MPWNNLLALAEKRCFPVTPTSHSTIGRISGIEFATIMMLPNSELHIQHESVLVENFSNLFAH